MAGGRRGGRRRWLVGGIAVLLVLAAAVAATAWHYSNDIVVPDHAGEPYDIEVVAAGDGQIELQAGQATTRPGIYGLEWPEGNAIVGPVVSEPDDGATVTRQLRQVEGELTPGQKVRINSYVFWGDPRTARGLDFKEVDVESELGPMPAWQIGSPDNRRWAIVVHGINGSRRVALPIAPTLERAGLTTLVISYRDDLGVPPSPDGKHHMGQTEWRDLEAAVRYATDRGAREIVLIGHSMGGAVVTQFLERSPLTEHVRGMVLDAPALNWPATIAFGARQMGLPSIASKPVEWMVGLRIEVDWDQLDALAHTHELTLPTLLFHGEQDEVVPIESSEEFAAALPQTVTYFPTPYADHIQSWNVAPRLYERRVARFLAEILSARASTAATAG